MPMLIARSSLSRPVSVAERLKQEGRAEQHATERTEEFEDSEGNVYDKKTYDDLKRQGLI
jgi:splicing factor 3A subunit 3